MVHNIRRYINAVVNEVIRIPDHDFDDRKIRDGISQALHTKQSPFADIGDIKITMGYYNPRKMDFIFRKRSPCGFALLERADVAGVDGWFVTEIGLLPSARGSGVGHAFYLMLLEKGFVLFSGAQQTSHSQELWKKLMRDPAVEVHLAVEDDLLPIDQIDPWQEPNATLIAQHKVTTV